VGSVGGEHLQEREPDRRVVGQRDPVIPVIRSVATAASLAERVRCRP